MKVAVFCFTLRQIFPMQMKTQNSHEPCVCDASTYIRIIAAAIYFSAFYEFKGHCQKTKTRSLQPGLSFFLCLSLFETVFLLELFYTAAAVDELLLTGEERMAFRAYIQTNFRLIRLCHKSITASASYLAVHIFRMDILFHFSLLLSFFS